LKRNISYAVDKGTGKIPAAFCFLFMPVTIKPCLRNSIRSTLRFYYSFSLGVKKINLVLANTNRGKTKR